MKKITAIIAFVLLLSVMTSCAAPLENASGGNLYDKKNDVTYRTAPSNYEAAAWESDVYIEDKNGFGYHKVRDEDGNVADPSHWLYNYENNILLYNIDIKLPTLTEMNPDTMSFFIEGDSRVFLTVEDDAESVKKAAELIEGPACRFSGKEAESSYRIKFSSSDYPFIAYYIIYLEYAEDQYEYVSLNDSEYESVEAVKASYDFIEGVPYEVIAEEDGSYTVAYNYGKYFLYSREKGKCYMAQYIHDTYNSPDSSSDSESA